MKIIGTNRQEVPSTQTVSNTNHSKNDQEDQFIPVGIYLFTNKGIPIIGIKWNADLLVEDEKIASLITAISNLDTKKEPEEQSIKSIKLKRATYLFCKKGEYIFAIAFPSSIKLNKQSVFQEVLREIPLESPSLEKILISLIINIQKHFPLEMICKIDFGEELSDETLENIYHKLEGKLGN